MVELKETNEKEFLASSSPTDSDSSCDNTVPKPVSVIGRMRGPTRRSTKGGWTEEEDKVLAVAVEKFNGKCWKKIAECVSHRSDVQCLHRWQKVLDPNLVKGPWSKEEDDLIIELVVKQGKNKKWSEIAKYLPGRIGKQCRERWHNHLNPDIVRTPWTKEEELILIEAHAKYGNKWAEIAKFLHGRTENSIKNHWNCTVKKKLEIYSSCGSALYSYDTKGESKNSEELRRSFDQKVNLERNLDTNSLDLVLGNAKDNCGFRPKEANDIIKQPIGIIIDDGGDAACGLTREQCRGSANAAHTSGESNHFTTNQPSKLFNTSSDDLVNSSCLHERTHASADLAHSVPSRKCSVPLLPSLNNPLDVPASCNRNIVLPVISKRLPDSFNRPQGNDCSRNSSGTLSGQSNHSMSSVLTHQLIEENKDARGPEIIEEVNHGFLSYESLQLKDLNTLLSTGRFPSTDSYIQKASSPVSFYTPPSHEKGMSISCGSPESILRSAARSYKNTPSIIRKRSFRTSRPIRDTNGSDGCSPEECKDDSNNSLQSPHLRPCKRNDAKRVIQSNAKQLFLSPPKSQKLDTPISMKSVDKRLEFAFDVEQDSASGNSRTLAANDSSGVISSY